MLRILAVYGKRLLFIVAGVILIGLPACGPTPPPAVSPTTPVPDPSPPSTTSPLAEVHATVPGKSVTIDLDAQNTSFNTDNITVPAGANVTINFNNKDSFNHNFSVYQILAGGQTKPIFIGDIEGRGSTVYKFTAPSAPGSYFFECDLHPQFMNGTFVVTSP